MVHERVNLVLVFCGYYSGSLSIRSKDASSCVLSSNKQDLIKLPLAATHLCCWGNRLPKTCLLLMAIPLGNSL